MGSTEDRRGIYHGDHQWLADADFCWFRKEPFQREEWHATEAEGPSFRLVHKISERVNCAPTYEGSLAFAVAVYVAEQHRGRSVAPRSSKVIIKIHMRIPNIPIKKGQKYVSKQDLESRQPPINEEAPEEPSQSYLDEVASLQHLTDHKCAHAPSFITTFQDYKHNPWVKGGFIGFIVMEKLLAVTVYDIWQWQPSSDAQRQEQLRIQEAFKTALLSVENLGVGPLDTAARNLMWDSRTGKCYLIDFEGTKIGKPRNRTWQEYIRHCQSSFSEFSAWGIIMQDQHVALRRDIETHQG